MVPRKLSSADYRTPLECGLSGQEVNAVTTIQASIAEVPAAPRRELLLQPLPPNMRDVQSMTSGATRLLSASTSPYARCDSDKANTDLLSGTFPAGHSAGTENGGIGSGYAGVRRVS